MGRAKRIWISYISCALLACDVLEVLLYCPDLRFGDDDIEPPVMEDVVPTTMTVSVVPHEPAVVVPEPPLVVPKSIFDLPTRLWGSMMTLRSHWDQWGSVRKLRNPLTIAFRLFLYAPYTPLHFWVMLCTFV